MPQDNRPATQEEVDAFVKNVEEVLGHPIKPMSEAERAEWHEKIWEEYYDENAREVITHYWVLMSEWEDTVEAKFGENSAEITELKTQTDAVKQKLNQIERKLHDPQVKAIMKPLRDIWAEYRGWEHNGSGDSNSDKSRSDQKSYRLSGEQLHSIYNRTIRPRIIGDKSPVEIPTFVIICAQPGAGKSGLSTRLQNNFSSALQDAVHVDVDELRRFHMHFQRIMEEDPVNMGDHTHEDASIWKGFLLTDCRAGKNNVVMEVTLKNADSTKREIERFQKEGYDVELHALAVHCNISRLGIFQRFERAASLPNATPRFVSLDIHDEAYHAMPRNVDEIERNCGLNLVTVNNRAGDIVYSRAGQNGFPEAMEAILLERNRSWTGEEQKANIQSWEKVVADMQARINDALKPSFYLADMQRAFNQATGRTIILLPTPAKEQNLYTPVSPKATGTDPSI